MNTPAEDRFLDLASTTESSPAPEGEMMKMAKRRHESLEEIDAQLKSILNSVLGSIEEEDQLENMTNRMREDYPDAL